MNNSCDHPHTPGGVGRLWKAPGTMSNAALTPLPINSCFRIIISGPRLRLESCRQELRGFVVGPIQVLNPDGWKSFIPLKPQIVQFIEPMHPKAVGSPVRAFPFPKGGVNQSKLFRAGVEYQVMRPQTHRGDPCKSVIVVIRESKDPRAVLGSEAAPGGRVTAR